MRTCAQPVVIRANCPKMKYHPLCGWIIIVLTVVSVFFGFGRLVFGFDNGLLFDFGV